MILAMRHLYLLSFLVLGSCQIIVYEEPTYYDDRDNVVGYYEVDEYSETTEQYFNYGIDVVKSCCNDNEIIIYNFYDVDLDVVASINGSRIKIPLQHIGDYEIEGTGRIENNSFTFTYVVHNRYQYPRTDFVSATAWR